MLKKHYIPIIIILIIVGSLFMWAVSNHQSSDFYEVTLLDLILILIEVLVGSLLVSLIFVISEKNSNKRQMLIIVDDMICKMIEKIDSDTMRMTTEIDRQGLLAMHSMIKTDLDLISDNSLHIPCKELLEDIKVMLSEYWKAVSEDLIVNEPVDLKIKTGLMNKKLDLIIQRLQRTRLELYSK